MSREQAEPLLELAYELEVELVELTDEELSADEEVLETSDELVFTTELELNGSDELEVDDTELLLINPIFGTHATLNSSGAGDTFEIMIFDPGSRQ